MKYLTSLLLLATVSVMPFFKAQGQSYSDLAGIFSNHDRVGTSRMQGVGYGMTALGGDLSAGVVNPAASGMLNRSNLVFTPAVYATSTEANFLNATEKDQTANFSIPFIGLNFHMPSKNSNSIYKGGSFNVSFARINDFHQKTAYKGNSDGGSLVEFFEDQAFGYTPDQLGNELMNSYAWLAHENYIINDSSLLDLNYPNDRYWSLVDKDWTNPNDIRTFDQEEKIETKGKQYTWNIGYGGNLNDVFFFGANIGIVSGKYESVKTYSESNFSFVLDPGFQPLDSYVLEEKLTVRSSGLNFSAGVIARPLDVLQLGFSIQSPTYYTLNDEYDATLTSYWNDIQDPGLGAEISQYTDIIISEYKLKTPLRMNFGAAFFIGKNGFITADAELVDYTSNVLSSSDFDIENDNAIVRNSFDKVVNLRFGAEIRIKQFRIRGGYQYLPSYLLSQDGEDLDRTTTAISAGLGIYKKKFFFDLATSISTQNGVYSPHFYSENVGLENNATTVSATLGFSF